MTDAVDPVSIGAKAEWFAWNDTEWISSEGGIRVLSADSKINPDAGKQLLIKSVQYFHGRRHDDEEKVLLLIRAC